MNKLCKKLYIYETVLRKKICICHKDILGYSSHIYD